MNLPSGTIIEENIQLKAEAILPRIKTMMAEEFSGYIVFTCEGFSGIEEGFLIFRKGKLVGSLFSYDKIAKEVLGETALMHSLNLLKAKKAIYDIIALTVQQVDLILAFNEEIKIARDYKFRDIERIIPEKYSDKYAQQTIGKEKEKTKEELYKELGLIGVE